MAYVTQYYYTLTISNGVATIAGGPFGNDSSWTLQNPNDPTATQFDVFDLLEVNESVEV